MVPSCLGSIRRRMFAAEGGVLVANEGKPLDPAGDSSKHVAARGKDIVADGAGVAADERLGLTRSSRPAAEVDKLLFKAELLLLFLISLLLQKS